MHRHPLRAFSIVLLLWAAAGLAAPLPGQFESLSPGDRRALVDGIVAETELVVAGDGAVEVSVKGSSGTPCSGVDVLVLPANGWNALPREERIALAKAAGRDRAARQVALAKRLGKRYRTDEQGVARIDAAAAVQVLLLDRRSIDVVVFRPGDDPVAFEVDDRPRLVVRVVDAFKRPVEGQQVCLGRGSQQLGFAASGSDGYAEFVLPDPRADGDAPYGDLEVALGFQVGVRSADAVSQPLDGYKPGDPPIELRMKPSGMVRFILYGPDEKPMEGLRSATLSYQAGRSQHTTSADETDADSAMFERVPLGLDVTVNAEIDGLIGQLSFAGVGPARPGELVIIEGRMSSGPSVVSGRLIGPDGEPLPGGEVGIAWVGDRRTNAFTGSLAQGGTFKLVLPEDVVGSDWTALGLYFERRRDGAPSVMAVFDLEDLVDGDPTQDPTGRSRELGDVALQEPGVLLSGVLVDQNGEPIEGFSVTARHTIFGHSWSSSTQYFRHSVKTGADGGFALHELSPRHGPVRLSFSGKGYAVETNVEAGIGENALRVEARPVGEISLAVDGAPLDGFDINVMLQREGAPQGVSQRVYLRNGRGRSSSIPAGSYDLTLAIDGREGGVTIEDVEIPAGGKATDPRLLAIPWKEHFRFVRVVVRDDKQRPMGNAGTIWRYITRNNGGRTGSGSYTDEQGVVRILCPLDNCKITADVDGFFKTSADADKDEIIFDLQPAPPVVVWLPEDTELPGGLQVNFHLGKGNGASYSDESVRPGQKVTLYPDETGDHTLTLQLSWAHGQQQRQVWNRYRRLMRVPVKIGASTEPIELELELDDDVRSLLRDAAEDLGLLDDKGGR